MNRIILLLITLIVISCSAQKKLQKSYVGQPVSVMEKEFGKAKTIFEKSEGQEYIFEKVEFLKSTEISQHKITLDPMITPKVKKITHYATLVRDGIIVEINVDEEYER
ncbi:hypothetical protein OU798_00755 [Prolixibacteraceae bacterium Z1-6]|uniref:Uncharacterized protein n=1 Tax=Draconibacterium aestuarii TaxID=2998507 RepID=A0A9X3F1I2_9BACT|nr:hypothetical protein [Prolixibacteraceae bacterium Z1-6]